MASLQHYSLRNNITMTKLLATIIADRPRSWSIGALVLLVGLLSIGCVDQAAFDDRECESRGFKKDAKEYEYCREKLQQFRDREWERRLKFIDMMS